MARSLSNAFGITAGPTAAVNSTPMPDRDYDAELRAQLRALRKAAGLSQEAVAAGLDTNQVNVSRWELELNPTLTKAAAFADVCGYELDLRFHKKGDLRELRASEDGARGAELLDSLSNEDRLLALRLLRILPRHQFKRGARGMIEDVIEALEELAKKDQATAS